MIPLSDWWPANGRLDAAAGSSHCDRRHRAFERPCIDRGADPACLKQPATAVRRTGVEFSMHYTVLLLRPGH